MTLDQFKRERPMVRNGHDARRLYRRGTLAPQRLHLRMVLIMVAYGIVLATGIMACGQIWEVVHR